MVWARYPDAPPAVPECALKIPLGRVGLAMPPRVGFNAVGNPASCVLSAYEHVLSKGRRAGRAASPQAGTPRWLPTTAG